MSPPFVVYNQNRFDGFAIDVWTAVAVRLGVDAVQADDPLRERLNRALSDVVESGDDAAIHERSFGVAPDVG